MEEIWKDIEGFEGEYMISNLGRVKSLKSNIILRQFEYRTGFEPANYFFKLTY